MANVVLKWSFLENIRNRIIEINGVVVDKTSDIERFKFQNTPITLFAKKETLPIQGKSEDVAKMQDIIKNFAISQADAAIVPASIQSHSHQSTEIEITS